MRSDYPGVDKTIIAGLLNELIAGGALQRRLVGLAEQWQDELYPRLLAVRDPYECRSLLRCGLPGRRLLDRTVWFHISLLLR